MAGITTEELDCRFTYHAPTDDQPAKYVKMRSKLRELADLIIELAPESREQELAITKLEECGMWANAAIARRSTKHEHRR